MSDKNSWEICSTLWLFHIVVHQELEKSSFEKIVNEKVKQQNLLIEVLNLGSFYGKESYSCWYIYS